MPFSDDHKIVSEVVGAMRSGFNPDGRHDGQGLPMAPDIWGRMMRGEISAHQANAEWREREPGQRAFNDELRRQIRPGLVGDTSVLSGEGAGAVRDGQTGQFADLDAAMRQAGHQEVPGGIVPTERTEPVDANAELRAAYERVVERRAEQRRNG